MQTLKRCVHCVTVLSRITSRNAIFALLLLNTSAVLAQDIQTDTADGAECLAVEDSPQCGDDALDPGTVPLGNLPNIFGGNPINLLSGNKHQKERDFGLPDSKLVLQRSYNSENADNNIGLGQGWHHSYTVSLFDSGNGAREIVQSNGSRLRFEADGTDAEGRPLMRSSHSNQGYLVKTEQHHEWHLPDGRTLRFKGSFLIEIDWPDQSRLVLFYRGARISRVSDETGRVLQFDYSAGSSQLPGYETKRFGVAEGHLASVTLPDGSKIGYDYDQNRNLSRVRLADGTSREYHYENLDYPNHLTGITDRTGVRASTWGYDASGRAHSSEHANGVQRLNVYYPDQQSVTAGDKVQTRVTNALGQKSTYTWRQISNKVPPLLLSSEGVPCTTCPPTGFTYTYDDNARLISKRRTGRGTSVGIDDIRYVYDELGRLVETWQSDTFSEEQQIERREYVGQSHQAHRIFTPSVNPAAEQESETERNARGLPVRITRRGFSPKIDNSGATLGYTPIERTIHLGYDDGRLTSVDGPRQDVDDTTRFVWDAQNRLTTIAMPDAPPMRITEFDEMGRAIEFVKGPLTDQSASPVTLSYNAESQVETITQGGQTLSFSFDAEGRLIGVVNAMGRQMELSYDEAGQFVGLSEPNGQRFSQDYDDEGRVVEQSLMDKAGELIRSVDTLYDARGLVSSVSRQIRVAGQDTISSTLIDYEYDDYNRAVRAANRFTSQSTAVDYNRFGDLSKVIDPSGSDVGIVYDAARQAVSLSDARGNQTHILKDDFGRTVALINADTGVSSYDYDEAGNPVQWSDAQGNTVSYTWNAANKPLLISRPEGDVRFIYDPVTGLLQETSNPHSTERYEYDRDSRVLAHERVIDDRQFVTRYAYDQKGRIHNRELPDGQSIRYHYYDEGPLVGRLRAVTRSTLFGLQQQVLLGEIDEDASDGTTGFIAHNGKRTTRTHAADGRITRIEISDTLTLSYRYDTSGRIIGIDENGIAQHFVYSNGLLSSADMLSGHYVFNYDDTGNRTEHNQTLANGEHTRTSYQHPDSGNGNRLLAIEQSDSSNQSPSPINYNASGSPLNRAEYRYEYNSQQRPVRVFKHDDLLAEYAYNSFGERIKKITYRGDGKRVTYFLYENHKLTTQINVDDDNSAGIMNQTLYLQGQPVLHLIGSDTYAVHTDQLGTPYLLSDEAGTIAWQAEYTVFGKAHLLVNDVRFNHRFPGQYEDEETGTHYNYLRDYDPDTGRYLTSDPLSIGGGLNTYQYAMADPLNLVDVLGLQPTMAQTEDLSGFESPGETAISGTDYARLISYAQDVNGLAYFQLLHELTGHALYADFASSYSGGSLTPALFLLRDVYLRYGPSGINQVGCFPDRSGIFVIPDVNLFSESLFQGLRNLRWTFRSTGHWATCCVIRVLATRYQGGYPVLAMGWIPFKVVSS